MGAVDDSGFREVRICGDCGAVAELNDSACPNCGAELEDDDEAES